VELVDILPTLLQAARIDIPKEVQGKSLLTLMKMEAGAAEGVDSGGVARPGGVCPVGVSPDRIRLEAPERSLRTGKYLYIQAPRRELYDQWADPKANHNWQGLPQR